MTGTHLNMTMLYDDIFFMSDLSFRKIRNILDPKFQRRLGNLPCHQNHQVTLIILTGQQFYISTLKHWLSTATKAVAPSHIHIHIFDF